MADGNNKPNQKINQKSSFGNLNQKHAPAGDSSRPLPPGGGGDAQILLDKDKRDCKAEQDWGAETSTPSPPPPPPLLPTPTSTKQDHSLTLGLFMKKSKKPAKLVPFKKKAETVGPAGDGKSASSAGNLKSSVFSNFKFGNDLTESQMPEAGPFEELWDSDFIEELEKELCMEEANNIQDDTCAENKVADEANDESWDKEEVQEIWDEEVQTSPSKGVVDQSGLLPRKTAEVKEPTYLNESSKEQIAADRSWDDENETSCNKTDEALWDEDSTLIPEKSVNGKAPVAATQEKCNMANSPSKERDNDLVDVQAEALQDTRGSPSNIHQDDDDWDEEIDVVGTPSPILFLPVGNEMDQIKNEPMWGEEPEHGQESPVQFLQESSLAHQDERCENESNLTSRQDGNFQEHVSFLQESSITHQTRKAENELKLTKSRDANAQCDGKPSVQMPKVNQIKCDTTTNHAVPPPAHYNTSTSPVKTLHTNALPADQGSKVPASMTSFSSAASVSPSSVTDQQKSLSTVPSATPSSTATTSQHFFATDQNKSSLSGASQTATLPENHGSQGPVTSGVQKMLPSTGQEMMSPVSYPMSVNAPTIPAMVPVLAPVQIQPR